MINIEPEFFLNNQLVDSKASKTTKTIISKASIIIYIETKSFFLTSYLRHFHVYGLQTHGVYVESLHINQIAKYPTTPFATQTISGCKRSHVVQKIILETMRNKGLSSMRYAKTNSKKASMFLLS